MSPVTDTPDLTTYLQIHRAMRTSAAQLRNAVHDLERTDRRRARHLAWWFDGFAGELHMHHVVEDEIFFPALAARVPTYSDHGDGLAADHVRLEELLAELGVLLHRLARDEEWIVTRTRALDLANELHDHLDEHLGLEDDDVLPLFARHFTAAEYEAMHQQAMKKGSLIQLAFTVPWLCSNLEPHELAAAFDGAPGILRVLWRATRGRYARRATAALGTAVGAVPGVAAGTGR
jgi:hemerythrin-like domain-containing protein